MQQRMYSKSKIKPQWLTCFRSNPKADIRFICFPFAGCGANFYRSWISLMPANIELHAVRLPGRETRSTQPYEQDLDRVVKAIVAELTHFYWQQPLVFFGHSMGAVIAFEVSRKLNVLYSWQPQLLFASGHQAPNVLSEDYFHQETDAALIEELKRLNGCPSVVFEDKELLKLYLAMLRSDYAIIENYQYRADNFLSCPIATCVGDRDSEVTPVEILYWKKMTEGSFFSGVFSGDHFYMNENLNELIAFVKVCLAKVA
jgi:surfactin synthase thioesterase subunit